MVKDDTWHLNFLKPNFNGIALFVIFLLIHVLGAYGDTPLGGKIFRFHPITFQNYYHALPDMLKTLFWGLWVIISIPLFIPARIFIALMGSIGINIYNFLNDQSVFLIFLIYYYILASLLATLVKKD